MLNTFINPWQLSINLSNKNSFRSLVSPSLIGHFAHRLVDLGFTHPPPRMLPHHHQDDGFHFLVPQTKPLQTPRNPRWVDSSYTP